MRKAKSIAFCALALMTAAVSYCRITSPGIGLTRPVAARATPFVQRDIVVDGVRVRYIDEGAGQPILLITGHSSRVEEYDELTASLRRNYRVLVLDMPGSGYSDKPDREYGLRYYEDFLLHFLDALGVDKCYLAGGSLGGNLALRLAAREPERFPRIGIWAPGSAWPARPLVASIIRSIGCECFFHPVVSIQSTYWYSHGWPGKEAALRETFVYYDEVVSPGFVKMYWGMAADQIGNSLFDIAGGISQPTLIMWGDQDNGLSMGDGVRRLQKLMPHASLKIFPSVRHSLATEKPLEVADALHEFFSRPADQLP